MADNDDAPTEGLTTGKVARRGAGGAWQQYKQAEKERLLKEKERRNRNAPAQNPAPKKAAKKSAAAKK